MKPNLIRPAKIHKAPTSTASIPARAMALSGLPAARGKIAAAMRPAKAESGPKTRILLGPKRA